MDDRLLSYRVAFPPSLRDSPHALQVAADRALKAFQHEVEEQCGPGSMAKYVVVSIVVEGFVDGGGDADDH